MVETSGSVGARSGGRTLPWFFLGVVTFLTGPLILLCLFFAKRFVTPWYLPVLGTAGALAMLGSAARERGIMRWVGAVIFAAACAGEWYVVAVAIRNPEYHGPARPGAALPKFSAKLADGRPIAESDFARGSPSALVFFRGRW